MDFFTAKPLYSFPLKFLFNKDLHQLIFVIILIWKLYYYFTTDDITTWDIANFTYKTTNYIFNIVNNLFNIILFVYFIIYFFINYK
jgi:hypothetical protein